MQVLAVVCDELLGRLRLLLAERPPLPEPPGGGADVEGADVELVDDERAARLDQLAEPAARSSSGSTWWRETTATAAANEPAGSSRSARATARTSSLSDRGSIASTS